MPNEGNEWLEHLTGKKNAGKKAIKTKIGPNSRYVSRAQRSRVAGKPIGRIGLELNTGQRKAVNVE